MHDLSFSSALDRATLTFRAAPGPLLAGTFMLLFVGTITSGLANGAISPQAPAFIRLIEALVAAGQAFDATGELAPVLLDELVASVWGLSGMFAILMIVMAVASLLNVVAYSYVWAGLVLTEAKVLDGGQGRLDDLFSGGNRALPLFLTFMALWVIGLGIDLVLLAMVAPAIAVGDPMVIAAAVCGSLLVFTVVAVYVGLGLCFARHAAVLEALDPIAALRRSWGMAAGIRLKLFGWFVGSAFLHLIAFVAGMLSCCFGLIFTTPLAWLLVDLMWTDLFLHRAGTPPSGPVVGSTQAGDTAV